MKKRIGQLVGFVGWCLMFPGGLLWVFGLIIAFGNAEAARRIEGVFHG